MILVADVRAHAVHIIPIAVREATTVVLMPTIAIRRVMAEVHRIIVEAHRTTTVQQLQAHHAVTAEEPVAAIVVAVDSAEVAVAADSAEAVASVAEAAEVASVAAVEPAEAEEDDSLEFKV